MEEFKKFLKDSDGKIKRYIDSKKSTYLHYSVEYYPKFVKLLLKHGFKKDINKKNKLGWTPLHVACIRNANIVELLLKNGAEPNIKNNQGIVPLLYACQYTPSVVKTLLKYGTDPNIQSNNKQSALFKSFEYNPKLVPILLKHKADPNLQDEYGMTSLHYACQFEPTYIDLLLSYKVDPNITDEQGNLAIHIAYQNPECKPYLALLELYTDVINKNHLKQMYKQYNELRNYMVDINARLIMEKLYSIKPYDKVYNDIKQQFFGLIMS